MPNCGEAFVGMIDPYKTLYQAVHCQNVTICNLLVHATALCQTIDVYGGPSVAQLLVKGPSGFLSASFTPYGRRLTHGGSPERDGGAVVGLGQANYEVGKTSIRRGYTLPCETRETRETYEVNLSLEKSSKKTTDI